MSATYRVARRRWAARRMTLTRWIAAPRTRVEFGAPLCEIEVDGRSETLVNDDDEHLTWGVYWHYLDAGQEIGPEAELFEYSYDGRLLVQPPTYDVRQRVLAYRRRPSYPPVFLSYRRAEADDDAAALHQILGRALGSEEQIFRDRVSIEPGEPFTWALQQAVAHCRAMVVMIGPTWNTITDDGRRRLYQESDYVRREVTAGLDRGILVLPVLLAGASAPTYQELPAEMRGFEQLQMVPLRREDWDGDVGRIVRYIRATIDT